VAAEAPERGGETSIQAGGELLGGDQGGWPASAVARKGICRLTAPMADRAVPMQQGEGAPAGMPRALVHPVAGHQKGLAAFCAEGRGTLRQLVQMEEEGGEGRVAGAQGLSQGGAEEGRAGGARPASSAGKKATSQMRVLGPGSVEGVQGLGPGEVQESTGAGVLALEALQAEGGEA
jgi:hypothetical protein